MALTHPDAPTLAPGTGWTTAATRQVRVLLVQEGPGGARSLLRALSDDGMSLVWRCATSVAELVELLAPDAWDVVVTGGEEPLPMVLESLRTVRRLRPELPCVVVADDADAEQSAELIRAGAQDILPHDGLAALGPAVERAVREAAERARRKAAEEELDWLAHHDSLTGLANREFLRGRIDRVLEAGAGPRCPFALLVVGLRRTREVNLALGRSFGDALLCVVGNELRNSLGDGAEVARLDGDLFGVMLPTPGGPEEAVRAARWVRQVVDSSHTVGGIQVDVAACVGIALCPEHGVDFDTLLRNAEVAVHAARQSESGQELYRPEADSFTERRISLMADLRPAIEQEQIALHYQPVVDLQSGGTVGLEALARWSHPRHGMIPPGEFIPLAEHSGAIRGLTLLVLRRALRDCAALQREGWPVAVAVNVSARNLGDARLVEQIEGLLRETGVPAGRLELEITETVLMDDPDRARETLGRLEALGVRASIDDFGMGYSSLAYLRKLPVRALKIDRSFLGVGGAEQRARDDVLIRAVLDVGHALGLTVVAEGVETAEALDAVRALGCDRAQGYHIARPMPLADLRLWLCDSEWGHRTPRGLPTALSPAAGGAR